jgi:hypothetical protein
MNFLHVTTRVLPSDYGPTLLFTNRIEDRATLQATRPYINFISMDTVKDNIKKDLKSMM